VLQRPGLDRGQGWTVTAGWTACGTGSRRGSCS